MFKWLWKIMDKHIPLEPEEAFADLQLPKLPLDTTPYSKPADPLHGIIETAMLEIADYETATFKVQSHTDLDGNLTWVAGLCDDTGNTLFDPINGEIALAHEAECAEDAVRGLRRKLLAYYPPPQARS